MRCFRYAGLLGQASRFSATVVVACLGFVSVVFATEMKELTEKLPHAYLGEFRWDGDSMPQNVVITFESVQALNEQTAEALGCGSYEVGRHITTIKVRMFIKLSKLQVEILELSPEGSGSFETGGSHRGTLSEDLQRIDAQWTTSNSGQQGQLHLRATATAACAPAASL